MPELTLPEGFAVEEVVPARPPDNPAKFSPRILEHVLLELARYHPDILKVLDPFAGIGGVHELRAHGYETLGIEIEPEWAATHPDTRRGDATLLRRTPAVLRAMPFDAIVTSPTYGNRMADHHNAQDACRSCGGEGMRDRPPDGGERRAGVSYVRVACPDCRGSGLTRRHTYRHLLGRPLHRNNTGQMQWGDQYRSHHRAAWQQAVDVLRPGGLFVLNIKDHVRDGQLQGVPGWHVRTLQQLGLTVDNVIPVTTRGMQDGANARLRADAELVITFTKEGPQ